ncbi:MAG: 2-phospho-L-lactate guanylyltransferase [Chloroflexi bacterium]|nr:2-phospho-L-lactate guanylyltransferase [Chloroflexota bacterium]
MSLWAIVPVKPLRRGKSRLAEALTEEERAALNEEMLARTLKTLSTLKEVDQVLVVSRDPHALTIARNHGAKTVQEDGQPHLNTALTRATVIAQVHAAQGVLILPVDLPLLTTDDVLALIDRATKPPVVVIAPDRHGKGTNALLMIPPQQIEYEFGEGSFQRHCEQAKQSGARLEIVDLPSLGLDLDLPEDLEMVRKLEASKV